MPPIPCLLHCPSLMTIVQDLLPCLRFRPLCLLRALRRCLLPICHLAHPPTSVLMGLPTSSRLATIPLLFLLPTLRLLLSSRHVRSTLLPLGDSLSALSLFLLVLSSPSTSFSQQRGAQRTSSSATARTTPRTLWRHANGSPCTVNSLAIPASPVFATRCGKTLPVLHMPSVWTRTHGSPVAESSSREDRTTATPSRMLCSRARTSSRRCHRD